MTLNKLPVFKSEKEESKFWQHNDSADYIDWNKAKIVTFISLRKEPTDPAKDTTES